MTRSEFQLLADERIRDAEALLKAGRHSAAYYLSGLAVECGLKACIARKTVEFEFPDLRRAQNAWRHNLDSLLKAADLSASLDERTQSGSQFTLNWNTAGNGRLTAATT